MAARATLSYDDYTVGIVSAITVAIQLLSSFYSIRFGLMVGIGGGVPNSNIDVRFGDIVKKVEFLNLFLRSEPK
ncbi:unnamed protein product [Penicillium camemberti]|uniref:Str. FM013 n=1 Tax=Penicillium camemberti (strain FM 013) TaxID=1429867 RepID=A0A0G4PX99_PENC3|nr:unnamed protein product [Penicillium camemberti]